jgi:hypothetical protein
MSPADMRYVLINIEYMRSGVRKGSFEEMRREAFHGAPSLQGPSVAVAQIDTFVIQSLSPPPKTDFSDSIACMVLRYQNNVAVRSTGTK